MFLILASDGVWDVFSNQQAAELVCSSAGDGISDVTDDAAGAVSAACFRAAAALCRAAIGRGSGDNVTALVVALNAGVGGGAGGGASQQAQC
jgi:protein phosphatase 2C